MRQIFAVQIFDHGIVRVVDFTKTRLRAFDALSWMTSHLKNDCRKVQAFKKLLRPVRFKQEGRTLPCRGCLASPGLAKPCGDRSPSPLDCDKLAEAARADAPTVL